MQHEKNTVTEVKIQLKFLVHVYENIVACIFEDMLPFLA